MFTYDFSIDTGSEFVNDKFSYVLQQIGVLFDSTRGDVLGDYQFGTDYESFIWDLQISNSTINAQITTDIYNNVDLADCSFTVSTDILNGTENDIILVTINLYFDDYSVTQTYNIG